MEDFDITEFEKMFDAALASDNPAVKKALRNFMMVAAIVHAQELNEDKRLAGPFESLLKKVQSLESMVRELQNNRTYKDNYKDYYNNHTWVTQPYTTNTTSVTSSDAKTWKGTYNGQTVESHEIYKLLKDLKIK
jgi:hypothetical protein